jgi:hypothetical protein
MAPQPPGARHDASVVLLAGIGLAVRARKADILRITSSARPLIKIKAD